MTAILETCMKAVQNNDLVLKYVPENIRHGAKNAKEFLTMCEGGAADDENARGPSM